jgi:hypothetical protein
MNFKLSGRKQFLPNLMYYLMRLEQQKTSLRTRSVLAEIWNHKICHTTADFFPSLSNFCTSHEIWKMTCKSETAFQEHAIAGVLTSWPSPSVRILLWESDMAVRYSRNLSPSTEPKDPSSCFQDIETRVPQMNRIHNRLTSLRFILILSPMCLYVFHVCNERYCWVLSTSVW